MPAIFELDKFRDLPLWAQALTASRMVRRAALAMLPAPPDPEHALVAKACDAIDACAQQGGGNHRVAPLLRRAMDLRDKDDAHADRRPLREALWWAVDAANAADRAQDFPIDGTVTMSAMNAVRSLAGDPRVNALQLTVLFAADFDQTRFACQEARVGRYDALTGHVASRLAPVHPITLDAPRARRASHADER